MSIYSDNPAAERRDGLCYLMFHLWFAHIWYKAEVPVVNTSKFSSIFHWVPCLAHGDQPRPL